jgi:cell wall-associated NlpC family hydrolase
MHPLREAVLKEAREWLGTPFHHFARIKGAGVDCGQFLLAVYERAGAIPHIETPYYPPDFHIHRDTEWYAGIVETWADEISGPPEPADIALYRIGRVFSHGSIVVKWPTIVHAYIAHRKVEVARGDGGSLAGHTVKFFSPHAFHLGQDESCMPVYNNPANLDMESEPKVP